MCYNLVTILGPTASGKTRLGAYLSSKFNGEIISADSRQVYKGMDIGTGKDYDDYEVNGRKVPFYLIDIVDPSEEYNLFRYKKDFIECHSSILKRKKTPFLVGGTGLYISSILNNYNLITADSRDEIIKSIQKLPIKELQEMLLKLKPQLHNTTDLIDRERIITAIAIEKSRIENPASSMLDYEVNSLNIGINIERSAQKEFITERLKKRLNTGMIEEVEKLLASGISHEKLLFFGLEYKYVSLYLQNTLTFNDMFQKLNSAIHQFAKRQMTWFRKMEKEGITIHWLNGFNPEEAENILLNSGLRPL